MNLTEVIARLRNLNEPVPRPARLPSDQEIAHAESELGVVFHPDFRRYLREASDVVHGTREPVTLTSPEAHTHLQAVAHTAWEIGVPGDWIPICEDNVDYYCMRPDGRIAFWSHQGASDETWGSLVDWIEREWIQE